MSKQFFDSWSASVGFESGLAKSSKLNIKKGEKMKVIDNLSLLEAMHQHRFREMEYGTDFIIVPRFVFFPLSKWYECNSVIERKVIQYKKNEKNSGLNLFKSSSKKLQGS